MTEKKQYNFYLSYWESYKELRTNAEKVEFIDLINKIHFFEEHIDRIKVKNANVRLLFVSTKHSLKASIKGYCDKKGIDYDALFDTPYQGGSQGAYQPPYQQTVKNKEERIKNKRGYIPFEDFWKPYPKKIAKPIAETNWEKLTQEQQDKCIKVVNSKVFLSWMKKQVRDGTDFRPRASVWLKEGRWEDDIYNKPVRQEPKQDIDVFAERSV